MCWEFQTTSCYSFSQLSLAELIDFVKEEDINTIDKNPVLNACIQWVNHDVESRQKALPDILSKIQIHQCTHEFIYYILNTYETLLEGHKIQNLLLCNIVKSLRKDKDFYLRQEKSCGNFDLSIALLGGLTRYDYARKCLLFHNNSWKHLTDIPGDASSLAVSTCSDGILSSPAWFSSHTSASLVEDKDSSK